MPSLRCSLFAAGAMVTIGGALVAACGAFDEATPPGGADASVADSVSPEAGLDATACAKPLITLTESFDGTISSWQTTTAGASVVEVGNSPDAGPGPTGSVLRAAIDVPDGGSSKAFVTKIIDAAPLAWVDLSYVVLIAAKPMYVEAGCQLSLRNKKVASFTGNLFALSREVSGAMSFAAVRQVGNAVESETGRPVGLDVTGPAHWYSVRVHIDTSGDTANVLVTVRDLVSGVSKDVPFANVPLVTGIDALQLDCGIYFANDRAGQFEAAVDEVSLSACPR